MIVSVAPAPTANFPPEPAVRSSNVTLTIELPMVTSPPPFTRNVLISEARPAPKNKVPNEPVAPTVKLELALPDRYFVADIPDTVPLRLSVFAPIVSVFAAPVIVSAPVIVGLPAIV